MSTTRTAPRESTFDSSLEDLIKQPRRKVSKSDQIRTFLSERTKLIRRALQVGNTMTTIAEELHRAEQFPKELSRLVLNEMFPEFRKQKKSEASKTHPHLKKEHTTAKSRSTPAANLKKVSTKNDIDQDSGLTHSRSESKAKSASPVHAGIRGRENL